MNKCLLLLFLFISPQGYSQSKCDCFERLYQLSNYENDDRKSAEILKDALSFLPVKNRGEYYWEVAERYRRIKLYDSAAKWYEKAVAESGYNINNLKLRMRDVYNRMDTNKMNAVIRKHKASMDLDLYEKFTAQLTLDQSIRGDVLFSYDAVWDTSSPVCQRNFVDAMFHRVDDSTYRFLMWVFNNYGYPTVQKLGFYPNGITQMILHVTAYKNENADRLLKKLEELSKNCEYMKYDILFYWSARNIIKIKRLTAA